MIDANNEPSVCLEYLIENRSCERHKRGAQRKARYYSNHNVNILRDV